MLTEYTSYSEIRSVLGVEDDELLDETLALPLYYNTLLEDMADTHPRLQELIGSTNEIPEGDLTPIQSRFLRGSSTFATYAVANQLASSLPMFAPRSLSDGKATTSRFTADPYKETIKRIESQFKLHQGRLQRIVDELEAENRGTAPRRVFVGVGLAYDPVTGTEQ